MRLLGDAGLHRINVPTEFGGLWDGGLYGGWREVMEAGTEIAAADGSTGQCWATTHHPRGAGAVRLGPAE
jgi:alkylation response protein AidB-like acyl-CoA dehydrogenase